MPASRISPKIFAKAVATDAERKGQLGMAGRAAGRAAGRLSGSPGPRRTKAETLFETTLGCHVKGSTARRHKGN